MSAAAIRLDALTKYYGPVIGVDGLSLDVEAGEIFGFLGANGAGKTTTIRLLLDLLRPTSGRATVHGFDARTQSREVRRRVGYTPGEMPIYPELTGEDYLAYFASIGGAPVSTAALDRWFRRFNVSAVDLKRRMRDYSHGMKRKLGIIQALMTDPPVLIFDEPTSGLDPLMIEAFGETVDELARSGRTTVFLSSHVLSEVERSCRRIGVVAGGRLVAVRTLAELRGATPRRVTVSFAQPVNAAPPPGLATVVLRAPDRWILDVTGPMGPLVNALAGLPVADIAVTAFSLEETVLNLMEAGRT